MRARAFRPEAPACLEARSLLSGVAGPSADPFVLQEARLVKAKDHIDGVFLVFATRGTDISHMRQQISDVVVWIPFGRADGLGVAINRILDRMRRDIPAGVPHPIRSANDDVIDVIREHVEARVRAGDVVVR